MRNSFVQQALCAFIGIAAVVPVHAAVKPASATATPKIISVSKIMPVKTQTITIKGANLGTHAAFQGTTNIKVEDTSTHPVWQASKVIVKSWKNTEIVLGGFAGDLTKPNFPLAKGNTVKIEVWNPQSGKGPAVWTGKIQ